MNHCNVRMQSELIVNNADFILYQQKVTKMKKNYAQRDTEYIMKDILIKFFTPVIKMWKIKK